MFLFQNLFRSVGTLTTSINFLCCKVHVIWEAIFLLLGYQLESDWWELNLKKWLVLLYTLITWPALSFLPPPLPVDPFIRRMLEQNTKQFISGQQLEMPWKIQRPPKVRSKTFKRAGWGLNFWRKYKKLFELLRSVTSEMWEALHQNENERYFLMNYQVLVWKTAV